MEVAGQLERLRPGQAAGHRLADAGSGEPQTAIQRFCARVALSLLAWKETNIRAGIYRPHTRPSPNITVCDEPGSWRTRATPPDWGGFTGLAGACAYDTTQW